MTKQEKQQAEALKPTNQQNFWKLSKIMRQQWLINNDMNFKTDILFPIIVLGLDILMLALLLGLAFMAHAFPGAVVMIIITFVCLLAVVLWTMYLMIVNKRGLFIFLRWKKNKKHPTIKTKKGSSKQPEQPTQPVSSEILQPTAQEIEDDLEL